MSEKSIKTHRLFYTVIMLALCFVVLVSVSVAWFITELKVTGSEDFRGSAIAAYFAGGDGTAEHPYEIEQPVHMYNLAWLQYMGIFNADEDGDGNIDMQYYFVVNNDIDMDGLIIPPIGTEEQPFVGNFNGQNYCISGATISNYLSVKEGDHGIEEHPAAVETFDEKIGDETAAIVGFFGVIGNWDGSISGLADDSQIVEVTNKTNAVYNFYLDDLTIRSDTAKSLIGLLAGYVSGSMENVGIGGESRIITAEDAEALNVASLQMTALISEYSLIGEYNGTTVEWVDKPTGGDGNEGGTIPEEGVGWGGSIDMYSLTRRISYMFYENAQNTSRTTDYHVSFYQYGNINYTYTHTTSSQTTYLGAGSVIPLNVDTDTMFAGDDIVKNNFVTNAYYNNLSNSSEIVLDSNTGYIVGGGSSTSSWIRMRINPISGSSYPGIKNSINSASSFTRSNFQLLTIDADGKVYRIKDSENQNTTFSALSGTEATADSLNLVKYSDVVSSFADTMNGKTMAYALRFYTTASGSYGIQVSGNNITSATTASTVSIGGEEYSNYELVNGAVNFNVKSMGMVTTIAGTYAQTSNSGAHSFFRLVELERDANNAISYARVIDKVYVKYASDGKTVTDVQYNDDLASTVGYTLVYDAENMNSLASYATAYYFEIPVKAGDYALGNLKGDVGGAYLMYLDVGANGDESAGGSGDEGGEEVTYLHTISGINFVDDAALTNRSMADYPVITVSLTVENPGISGLTATYNRTGRLSMSYELSNTTDFSASHLSTTDSEGKKVSFNGEQTAAVLRIKKREDEPYSSA